VEQAPDAHLVGTLQVGARERLRDEQALEVGALPGYPGGRPKPGRPQRSQRRSFVVGQPQVPVWAPQPRQAQTRERAIHGSPTASGAHPIIR
jgi:hypothetical protein